MSFCKLALIFCTALVFQRCNCQLSPSVCTDGEYVVLGSPFSLRVDDDMFEGAATESSVEGNCTFWDYESSISLQSGTSWIRQGSSYIFNSTGTFGYNCNNWNIGNLTVVPAQYTIPLCKGCGQTGDFRLRRGESLQWVLVPEDIESPSPVCSVAINGSSGREILPGTASDSSQYVFQEAGTFLLYCKEDTGFNATIVVQGDAAATNRFLPLLYAHAALMILSFGILFPIAVFLYCRNYLAYLVLFILVWILSIIGFVLVMFYIWLTTGHFFRRIIHAALGYPVMFEYVVGLPLLLVHKKLKPFHARLSHVVMSVGITGVVTGLGILPAPFVAAISVCAVYGLILLAMSIFYILYSPKETATKVDVTATNTSFEMNEKVKPNGTLSHNPSSSSLQSRGPQPLTKNVISDAKMVQLRKKSMDFLEAQRQMRKINEELGAKHQLTQDMDMEEDESRKVRMEQKVSKSPTPDQDSPDGYDLEDSRAPLNPSSPEMDDPFSPPVRHHRPRSYSTDEDDEDGEKLTTPGIMRASTFSYDRRHRRPDDQYPESDTGSERGGSIRITRHSKRARVKLDRMFNKSGLVESEVAPAAPMFSITPSTPQMGSPITSESDLQKASIRTAEPAPIPALAQPSARSAIAGRRRKAAMVPPMISELNQPIEVSVGIEQPLGCPLQSSLAVKGRTPSPRPCRRGISPRAASPCGSSGGEGDNSAPPKRKKKVSVAQIEATVVPPTPINLMPPQQPSLSRSTSFETLRTHQDAFADNAFRSITQISQNAIVCANSVGDIVFWSAGACKMFGYTPGEAAGSSLEMIIPTSFKERHRNGISKRTEETMKYIRKHSYAPEEQKHARLYEVRGVTKGGIEIPVEVNVSSFVLDGEMFFTGVISEMAKPKDSKRSSVSSSMSDLNEVALHQRALAVGAQMKIAHKFRSAEHISRRELEKVLKGSLGTGFEVDPAEIEVMITGIMKAGDPEDTGAITFVSLIQLLSKHQLYISESGLIARYGKTKGSEMQNRNLTFTDKLQEFLSNHATFLLWFLIYVGLNLILFAAGVGVYSTDSAIRNTWSMWAYGAGPVLSMNTVLVLLPTLLGMINAMKGIRWMNIVFPLTKPIMFHVIISGGIIFWTVVHLVTHLTSFAIDSPNNSFRAGIRENAFPTATGIVILIIFTVMGVSSIKPLRSLLRYIPFRLIHWVGGALFYLLLLVHGVKYWNPSFWKWLLPALIAFAVERLYRHVIIRKSKLNVKCAGRYDSVSRTAIVELDKPRNINYEPGQYILLNLPRIGQFEWQPCHISSGPKEEKLTVHIPFSDDLWFKRAFEYLKANPYNMPKPNSNSRGGGREKNAKQSEAENGGESPNIFPAYFTGPYGTMDSIKQLFKYKISTLVCAGEGPHAAKAIIKKFLDYRKTVACHCGCQPSLSKLYFVWIIPSGNDFEWFSDYLSELCEDEHLHHYLHIRVFLTNCDSAPDELASALLQLGLKTAGDKVTARRPSQPQLNNLYHMTSYGLPDFTSLLDYISTHHSTLWNDKRHSGSGVFTVGDLSYSTNKDLHLAITKSSKPEQMVFHHHRILT